MLAEFVDGFTLYRRLLAGANVSLESKVQLIKEVAYQAAKDWEPNGLARAETVDELHNLAESSGLVAAVGEDMVQNYISNAIEEGESERPILEPRRANGHNRPDVKDISVVFPFPINGELLPRRPVLVPGLLQRKQLSLNVAPPGSGKSLLTLQLGIMSSCGIPSWAGWRPRGRYRVMIINVEEDEDEMRRRLYAAAAIMGISHNELGGLCIAQTDKIVVAKADSRTKTVRAEPMLDRIISTVLHLGIDVLVVDPFAETFEGDENSNSELKWAAVLWREVARLTNTAVLLVHHAKKYAQHMAGDPDAGRGGGSLAGVARFVSTLFTMTEEEAVTLKVPEEDRYRYIRHDDAKANLNLVSRTARWFRKDSYTLPNAGDGQPGDDVGVLVPWDAPDAFADMSVEMANRILDELQIGARDEDGEPTGDPYGERKSKRWAGTVIQQNLQCDEKTAKHIIEKWVANGVLEVVQQKISTSKGQLRDCIIVIQSNRPGTVTDDVSL